MNKRIFPVQKARVLAWASRGDDPRDIAKRVGICEETVFRWCQENGIEVHRKRHYGVTPVGRAIIRRVKRKDGGETIDLRVPTGVVRMMGWEDRTWVRCEAKPCGISIILEPMEAK